MSTAYPVVDYDGHPAFDVTVDASQADRSAAYVDVIERLDALFAPIRDAERPVSVGQVRRMTKSKLAVCVDDARRLLHAAQGAREVGAIDIALDNAAAELQAEAAYRSRSARQVEGSTFRSPVAKALDSTGAFECHLDADGKQRLCDALETRKQLIEAGEAEANPKLYKALTVVPRGGDEAELLLDLLHGAGIPEGFEEFFNCPLELHFWTLIRSDPTEVWWKDAYREAGVPTSPTTYFHIDSGYDGPKAMIYLGEVTEDHGPFEYLPGSHRWQRSVSQEILNKQIERAHKAAWVNEDTDYYRPYMQLADFRQALMNLPTPARQQSHFGDDVLAGSELHSFIDRSKRSVSSDVADCVAFDGNRMTHRGSLARGSRRWALQVGFEPKPTQARAAVRRVRATAGSLRQRTR